MLTFFDYLRKRTYESIVRGAREAIEFLDQEAVHENKTAGVVRPENLRPLDSNINLELPDSEFDSGSSSEPSHQSSAVAPPRKKRGRPKKAQG